MHELYSKYISSRARIKVKSVGHKDCVLDIVPMLPPAHAWLPLGIAHSLHSLGAHELPGARAGPDGVGEGIWPLSLTCSGVWTGYLSGSMCFYSIKQETL